MCAAVLYPDGEVEECVTSHLKTLMDRLGEGAWDQIPKDESPLFWLTGLTGAVLIDYENQMNLKSVMLPISCFFKIICRVLGLSKQNLTASTSNSGL